MASSVVSDALGFQLPTILGKRYAEPIDRALRKESYVLEQIRYDVHDATCRCTCRCALAQADGMTSGTWWLVIRGNRVSTSLR